MTAGYTYNGNGQRIKKVVNGVTTIFHYGLSGQIIAESNSAGSITTEYVYLNSQPLAKIEGANVYYYHNDHLATPQKMTDGTGVVVWSADYKPFGEATVTVSTIANNLRFPGQYYDAETGLNYNYFRDYNPIIGRYIEADPIGIMSGQNHLYVYAAANPVKMFDYYGLHMMIFPRPPNPNNYKNQCELIRATYKAVREAIATLEHHLEHMRSNSWDYWIGNITRTDQIQFKIRQIERWKKDEEYLFQQIIQVCKPCDW